MSKKLLPAIALMVALTVSAEAYAGIVIRFKNGTVLCIGSKSFCGGLLAKTQGTVTQVPGYSDKLNVNVAGKQFSADSVTVSEVNGDTGVVTVQLGGRTLFSGTTSLSNSVVTDATNGQQNKLSEFQFDSCSK